MKVYKKLFESSFKSIAGFYDNRNFRVAKSKDAFHQFRRDLLANGYKGVVQIPINIFNDDFDILSDLPKYSWKTRDNISDLLGNYKSIEDIDEM